jgi:hypothetical protein
MIDCFICTCIVRLNTNKLNYRTYLLVLKCIDSVISSKSEYSPSLDRVSLGLLIDYLSFVFN